MISLTENRTSLPAQTHLQPPSEAVSSALAERKASENLLDIAESSGDKLVVIESIEDLKAHWRTLDIDSNVGLKPDQVRSFLRSIWSLKNIQCRTEAMRVLVIQDHLELYKRLMDTRVVQLVKVWLREAIKANNNDQIIQYILTALQRLPLKTEHITDVGKLVKHLAQKHSDPLVKKKAERLMTSWQKLVAQTVVKDPVVNVIKQQQEPVQQPKKIKFAEVDIFNALDILNTPVQVKRKLRASPTEQSQDVPFRDPVESVSLESLQSSTASSTEAVRPNKKKKSVRWKPDNQLEEVRYFESNVEERHNLSHSYREVERGEGAAIRSKPSLEALQSQQGSSINKLQEQPWYEPVQIAHLDIAPLNSQELQAQLERVKNILSVSFVDGVMVPNSAEEPQSVQYNDDSSALIVPLFNDIVKQQQAQSADAMLQQLSGNADFARLMMQFNGGSAVVQPQHQNGQQTFQQLQLPQFQPQVAQYQNFQIPQQNLLPYNMSYIPAQPVPSLGFQPNKKSKNKRYQ